MARDVVADVLLVAGTVLTVLAALAMLRPGPVYRRLHYLTVVTSAAGPLLGLAVAVSSGLGLTTALVLVIVALLAITGPVLGAAIARLNAVRDGLAEPERVE